VRKQSVAALLLLDGELFRGQSSPASMGSGASGPWDLRRVIQQELNPSGSRLGLLFELSGNGLQFALTLAGAAAVPS